MSSILNFDLDSLSEAELRDLNRVIVERLNWFTSVRRHQQLRAFRVGDRVEFESEYGILGGIVMKLNQKTATIAADDGRPWRVSPSFLRSVDAPRDVTDQLKLVE